MPNFSECATRYLSGQPDPRYMWTGKVKGIPQNKSTQVSYAGCVALCGDGSQWYPWDQASSTITTWLLPVVGMLLQAPFESNAFWHTICAIARWVGSPMSSLSYILWNVSVSGKCALMVDMAVSYESRFSTEQQINDFNDIRDSFYILMTMNQFSIRSIPQVKQEAEGLLRIVLFSKDLKLINPEQISDIRRKNLAQKRRDLADALRRRRRRGVVPVFVSTMWFLFSLGLSIQSAFGYVGQNATAHDLALGMLLGWLPILVLCSIVDRNPLSADDVRDKLNSLVSLVCKSLQDSDCVEEYIRVYCTGPGEEDMRRRFRDISRSADFLDGGDFFTQFAGQGRVRWHYGVAHPILSDIENSYVQERGREWMRNENEARTKLVLGSDNRGLFWFDRRQLWQITCAIILVAGNCLGAYILSYYTPTVGLGCRSLGYLVFCINSLGLLGLEFLVWRSTSEEREAYNILHRNRRPTFDNRIRAQSIVAMQRTRSWLATPGEAIENIAKKWIPIVLSYTYIGDRTARREKLQRKMEDGFQAMHNYNSRQWWNILFFVPAEMVNTIWLVKIVLSQTFGEYVSCWCQSSLYGFGGGYMDLSMVINADLKFVRWNWITGTVVSSFVLAMGLAYVVIEWCLQSHLSTLEKDAAREGLQRTRAFRRCTTYIRLPLQWAVLHINELWYVFRPPERKQKTLVWRRLGTYQPDPDQSSSLHFPSVPDSNQLEPYPRSPDPSFYERHPPSPYGRPRASTETDTRSLLATPQIVTPPATDGHERLYHHRTYSNASSISINAQMRAQQVEFLGEGQGATISPMGSPPVQHLMPSTKYLRPRPSHQRQASDEAVTRVDEEGSRGS